MRAIGLRAAAALSGKSRSHIYRAAASGRLGSVTITKSGEKQVSILALSRLTGISYTDEQIQKASRRKKRGRQSSGKKIYSQADLEAAIADAIERDRANRREAENG